MKGAARILPMVIHQKQRGLLRVEYIIKRVASMQLRLLVPAANIHHHLYLRDQEHPYFRDVDHDLHRSRCGHFYQSRIASAHRE